ncbi:hypothetical protein [Actinomadura roseirufa]|uniref:hypothetical protein n=1 Tax=Actinomadura roseirufa TaxID=2094049 RepID=UPI00104126AE|nr:hypothetical protein [Actinomadura roseirufa]
MDCAPSERAAAAAPVPVVLADARRLTGCFPAIDYFERRRLPFVVALNRFEGAEARRPEDVAVALDLDPGVPVLDCDARRRESSRRVLVALMEHVLSPPGPGATRPDGDDQQVERREPLT